MSGRAVALIALVWLGACGLASETAALPVVPPSFAVDDAAPGAVFLVPTAMAFLPDGRFLVAEKRGRVYEVRDGIRQPNPLWAHENEVLDEHDRGLLGLAVDPNYFANHYIYLFYCVDPDSDGNDLNDDAFTRLTRYQVGFADSSVVDSSTRTILLGVDWPHAPISASPSHLGGCLRWGTDGSLLVSVGDGAQFDLADVGGNDPGEFGPGRADPYQDVGAFRAQDILSLNGKILRLDPANGLGYTSNPYYDGDPASIRSRVWCYGLRNPFRFTVRPGSGASNPAAGDPGSLYIGDVGWNNFDEMDIAPGSGFNFGWPCYEALHYNNSYQIANPAHSGCGTTGTPTNPSPFTAPATSWSHGIPDLSDPQGFTGNCSIGGAFYTGTRYPPIYRGQYFFADYGQNWIKVCVVDSADDRVQLLDFGSSLDGPVDFAVHPLTGDLYYISITNQQVRRIRYTGTVDGNSPPVAAISAAPALGAAPLRVSFSAAGSVDPDGDPLDYRWLFGDGTAGTGLSTSHLYNSFGIITPQLTVTDSHGAVDVKTAELVISPPGTGFPTTNILDDFNRPDGPVGPPWVDNTVGLSIVSTVLTTVAPTNTTVWNGASFGPKQEAFMTLVAPIEVGEENLMLKVQGTSWSTGHIEVRYDPGARTVTVNTYDPGQGWFGRGIASVTFLPGDQFGARADSDSVVVFKNGASVARFSLGEWQFAHNGGRIGITATGLQNGGLIDNFGGGDVVTITNTRPVAKILQPADGSTYYASQTIDLSGTGQDAESPPDQLFYEWIVDLLHNNHVHPSIYDFTGSQAAFTGMNHDDGTGVHLLIKFTATDPQGYVSDTAYVSIWPEIDLRPGEIVVTPSQPAANSSTQFSFAIHNDGRMPAPISHWVLSAGHQVIAQGDTVVNALDSLTQTITASLGVPGFVTVRLTADSLGAVHETNEANNVSLRTVAVTRGLADAPEAPPARLELSLPSPNPSRGPVSFALALPEAAEVDLKVLDLQGRLIYEEPRRQRQPGRWTLAWDGNLAGRRPAPAGVYLARIRVAKENFTRRIALIR